MLNTIHGFVKIKFVIKLKVLIATILLLFFETHSTTLAQSINKSAIPNKNLRVDYADYNNILKGLVMDKGPSSRTYPKKIAPPVGTRISFVNKKITRLESNRVFFHLLKDGHKQYIHTVLQSLEALPNEIPLKFFSKDEQLAYWLNLRNLTVLDSVSQAYPIMKLKKFWRKLENEKKLTVAGNHMSINDIEEFITTNWPHAHVIYGFYNGSIGGPNIREKAYTGKFVWEDLNQNAKEFVNSLRGVQFYKKTTKISDFYIKYPTFFMKFNEDVKKHVRANLNPALVQKMDATTLLKFTINDWSIADLMNGRLGLSSAASIGPAALLLAHMTGPGAKGYKQTFIAKEMQYVGLQKYPAHVQVYLAGMKNRFKNLKGIVTIDEVDSTTRDLSVKKPKKKN